MDKEKVNIVFADGQKSAEVIWREGEAPKVLDKKAPIPMNIYGVLNAPLEFLTKRINTGQFEEDCHILVNREKISITLHINESDPYKRGQITGTLQIHPKFEEFGVNQNKVWTPIELGIFFKMNRTFFADKQTNMKIVSELMNFKATVESKIERSVSENGNRTDNFAQIVNSNLPSIFTISIPLFKGGNYEQIEVETFAKIDGRDVHFMLISPGAQSTLEELRDKAIDEQLEAIREIAPEIAIMEV